MRRSTVSLKLIEGRGRQHRPAHATWTKRVPPALPIADDLPLTAYFRPRTALVTGAIIGIIFWTVLLFAGQLVLR
jgi:hypothetical protein